MRGDGAREGLMVELERLAVGHGAVVEGAEGCDEIHRVRAGVAIVVLGVADAAAMTPEERGGDDEEQQQEGAEVPLPEKVDHPAATLETVDRFVKVDRTPSPGDGGEQRQCLATSDVLVVEEVRLRRGCYVAPA